MSDGHHVTIRKRANVIRKNDNAIRFSAQLASMTNAAGRECLLLCQGGSGRGSTADRSACGISAIPSDPCPGAGLRHSASCFNRQMTLRSVARRCREAAKLQTQFPTMLHPGVAIGRPLAPWRAPETKCSRPASRLREVAVARPSSYSNSRGRQARFSRGASGIWRRAD